MSRECATPNQRAAYLYAGSAVLLWSTVATAFKLALRSLGVVEFLFIASLTSSLVLLLIVFLRKKLYRLKQLSRRSLLLSLLLGCMNPLLYYTILFTAYDRLPAQIAQPLNYTWPILLALLSVPLLHHSLSRKKLIGILTAFAGVVIISSGGGTGQARSDPAGVLLALGSALIWALYWIINTRDRQEPEIRLLLNFLFGTGVIGVFSVFKGFTLPPDPLALGAAIYTGLFEMGITFFLWTHALKKTASAGNISRLIYLSPFISMLFIALILKESLLPSSLIGLILIIAGVIFS